MILKEKQPNNSIDPKLKAGEHAELQMAFYLKRVFGKSDEHIVINDLRIDYQGDIAQIDHLIITQFGLFIVESKSVHGTISVNKNEEWSRSFNKTPSGMPSPVIQAKAQAKVLKALLIANVEQLLGKILGLQKGFGACPFLIYVAISDTGIIDRKTDIPELKKADQITQEIELKIKEFKKSSSLLGAFIASEPAWSMKVEETIKVAEFLANQHTPLVKHNTRSPTLAVDNPSTANKLMPNEGEPCPQCKSHTLLKKSVKRSDGTETHFIACEAYPDKCKAIYGLVTSVKAKESSTEKSDGAEHYKEHEVCPKCNIGMLVKRKAKTEFLGCSQYPKCKFTSYR